MNRITKNVLAWDFFDGQDAEEFLKSYVLCDRDNKRLNTLDPSDRYAALVKMIRDALADRLAQIHEDFIMMDAQHSPYTERLLRIAMRDIDFIELIDAQGWNHAVTETANFVWFGNPEGGQQAQSIRFKTTGKDIHTDLDKAIGDTHD